MQSKILILIVIVASVKFLGCGGSSSPTDQNAENNRPDRSKSSGKKSMSGPPTVEEQIAQGNFSLIMTKEFTSSSMFENQILFEMYEMDDITVIPDTNRTNDASKSKQAQIHNEKMTAAIEKAYGAGYVQKIRKMANDEWQSSGRGASNGEWKKRWKTSRPN